MRLGPLALGAILSVGVCTSAIAQAVPSVGTAREYKFGFHTDVTYDDNVGRTSAALSAARHIIPQDELVSPAADFHIVQPVGQQALFLDGQVGYDFHKKNTRLNRENIDVTGGGVLTLLHCRTTIYGKYAALQSDLQDLSGLLVQNLLTTTAEAIGTQCGSGRGFTGSGVVQHRDVTNSLAFQKAADHKSDSVSGSFGYGNTSLGVLMLTGSYSKNGYPNRIDPTTGAAAGGFASESIGVSYEKAFGSKINTSVMVSENTLRRDFAPAGIGSKVTGVNYLVSVEYRASSRLSLKAHSQRAFQPSNRAGKLYDLVTSSELTGDYTLGNRFTIELNGIVDDLKSNKDTTILIPTPTKSRKKTISGSLHYRQSDRASLVLDLRHESKVTDLPNFNYDDNRATLTLAVSF